MVCCADPQPAGSTLLNRRLPLTNTEQVYAGGAHYRSGGSRPWRANVTVVTELAKLLLAHPGGLRRWSVMRAMRRAWEGAQQEVSQKFEDEVERNFRYFSADDDCAKYPERGHDAIFFRPSDKAGEVWAVNLDRVRAWLVANDAVANDSERLP
jgi:hypothetical protein